MSSEADLAVSEEIVVNAVSSLKLDAGPIVKRITFHKLAPRLLAGGWLLAASLATPPLAAQEAKDSSARTSGRGHLPRTMAPRGAAVSNDSGGRTFDTGNKINYNGGPVLLGTTRIYYIWYGNWDAGSVGILSNFASHIGGTPYFNINTGYYD